MDRNIYLKILKLFGNKGVRFTTEDLAKELGTSKRTIYSYFSNKDDIIGKTIDFVFSEIITSDNEILEDSKRSLQEKLRLYFENIPDAYNLGSIVRHMDDLRRYYPHLWEKVNSHMNTISDSVIRLINQGIKDNELEEVDTVILKLILDQTLKTLLDYEFLAKNEVSFDSGFKALNKIVLYGLIKRTGDEAH